MSDQPVTLSVLTSALATVHEEVIAPDIRRIVQESESRLRTQMQVSHDSIVEKISRITRTSPGAVPD